MDNSTTESDYLSSLDFSALARPKQVRAGSDRAALVRLLEQLGGGQGALGAQRLMVLLAEAADLLEGADDQRDGGQLGLGVADLIFVQCERLRRAAQTVAPQIITTRGIPSPAMPSLDWEELGDWGE